MMSVMTTDAYAGPIDVLVFTFPDRAPIGTGLDLVLERVDAGLIEILDLEFVRVENGAPVRLTLADVEAATGADLSAFEGAESLILDDDDLAQIAADLEPEHFAVALVYEERTLAVAAGAWTSVGGTELLAGGVDIDDLERAIALAPERNDA